MDTAPVTVAKEDPRQADIFPLLANFVIAYLLIARVGHFDLHATDQVVVAVGVGVLLIGVMAARVFGRFHGGNAPTGS